MQLIDVSFTKETAYFSLNHVAKIPSGKHSGAEHKREFQEGVDFVSRWKNRHPLVTPMLAPHASDTVSLEWLKELRQIATEQGV